MKRSALRKKGKTSLSKIQRDLWQECRRVANIVYPSECYTCGAKNLVGSNKQLGHVPWPKSVLSALVKYDLRFLRWQCMRCNIHGGGMGAVAYEKMCNETGPLYMEEMKRDKNAIVKAMDVYVRQLAEYRAIKEDQL